MAEVASGEGRFLGDARTASRGTRQASRPLERGCGQCGEAATDGSWWGVVVVSVVLGPPWRRLALRPSVSLHPASV